MSLPLSCKIFEGKDADQYNVLRSAFTTAAKRAGFEGEYAEYEYLENVARTSLTVELIQAIHAHGYSIQKTI